MLLKREGGCELTCAMTGWALCAFLTRWCLSLEYSPGDVVVKPSWHEERGIADRMRNGICSMA